VLNRVEPLLGRHSRGDFKLEGKTAYLSQKREERLRRGPRSRSKLTLCIVPSQNAARGEKRPEQGHVLKIRKTTRI